MLALVAPGVEGGLVLSFGHNCAACEQHAAMKLTVLGLWLTSPEHLLM